MLNKTESARQRYVQLKELISKIQHAENGNLIPNNQKEFDDVKREIEDLEKEYPDFNFFKNSEL